MKPHLKACIYARVSTVQQTDGTSLAGQYAACFKRAQDEGADVIAAFEEVKSGGLYQTRGQLQKALGLIESGEANLLILSRLDRTGREVEALRDVRRRVEAAGARLVFADGLTFEKGAVGNLLFTQLAGFAEFERELIRERMVAGLERAARAGRMPSRTHPALGYLIVTKAHIIRREFPAEAEGTYIVKEDEVPTVKRIFEAVAGGTSLRRLARDLDGDGIRPRRAKKWAINSLRSIVINEIYKGEANWRKTERHVDESRAGVGLRPAFSKARPLNERIIIPAPAIIEPSLWERANHILECGRQERSGHQERRYLLAGFGRCPLCGDRLHSRLAVRVKSDTSRQKVWLYRCAGSTRGTCELPSFGGPQMESLVIEALAELVSSPHLIETATREFEKQQEEQRGQKQRGPSRASLERGLERARAKERAIAEMMIEARLAGRDGNALETLAAESQAKRVDLESQLIALNAPVPETAKLQLPVFEADDLRTVLECDSVSALDKGRVLRSLVSRVYPLRFCDTSLPPECHPQKSGKGVSTRTLAGVAIVLAAGAETGRKAFYVLRRVASSRVQVPGCRNRPKWHVEYITTLELCDSDPFPPLPPHCAPTRLQRDKKAL